MTTETEQPLNEEFNESAAFYRAAFPKQLANLVISSGRDIVYASPEIAASLTENVAEAQQMVTERLDAMYARSTGGGAGQEKIKGIKLNYLSFIEGAFPQLVSDKYPSARNLIYVFDHEIGHFVAGNSEGAADAFAMLRHLQRYGDDTDIFKQAPYLHAGRAILNSPIHYTSPVIQKIEALWRDDSAKIKFLSPKETAALARDIAIEYANEKTQKKIHNAYELVRAHLEAGRHWGQVIKVLINVMLENKDDQDIYRAGKLYLGRSDMKTVIARFGADAELQKGLAQLEEHEKKSGFILNAADAKAAVHNVKKTSAIKPFIRR